MRAKVKTKKVGKDKSLPTFSYILKPVLDLVERNPYRIIPESGSSLIIASACTKI